MTLNGRSDSRRSPRVRASSWLVVILISTRIGKWDVCVWKINMYINCVDIAYLQLASAQQDDVLMERWMAIILVKVKTRRAFGEFEKSASGMPLI